MCQDDAQIGVDVLNWRQTITGVGHCRQVRHVAISLHMIVECNEQLAEFVIMLITSV